VTKPPDERTHTTVDIDGASLPGGWDVYVEVVRDENSRPGIRRLMVYWPDRAGPMPAAGITTGVLRSVRINELLAKLDMQAAEVAEIDSWAGELRTGWAPPRHKQPERQYALLAYFYAKWADARLHDPSMDPPTKALADVLGWTRSTTDLRLATARRLGFLGKSAPGVAGGGLTDKARQLLVPARKRPDFPTRKAGR
jgi:hypothetical protein